MLDTFNTIERWYENGGCNGRQRSDDSTLIIERGLEFGSFPLENKGKHPLVLDGMRKLMRMLA